MWLSSLGQAEEIPLDRLTADNLMPEMKLSDDEVMNYTPVLRY